MFQKDYILRMIEQFTKVLAKVLFNKETKNYETALDEIQKNYAGVFGIDKELISISSAEEIISLLKLGGNAKPKVFVMLADYLKEEADLHKELKDLSYEEIFKIYYKSLLLYYEAVLNNSEFQTKDNYEKIDSMTSAPGKFPKQPDLIIKTIRYYELKGEYAKAENLLFELIDLNPTAAVAEGEKFYNRLKDKSDEDLSKGNFSRDEIEQGFSEFKERIKNLPQDS